MHFIIERKILIGMLFIGLSLLGFISYGYLSQEIMPAVEYPSLIISVNASQEVDPSYMERQAVIPLEGAAGILEGVSSIESQINQRGATITVYFDRTVDLRYAYLKLQENVNTTAAGLSDEFSVRTSKVDTQRLSNTFMTVQVRGEGGLQRVRAIVDEKITTELGNIDGISTVDVTGGNQISVDIVLNDAAAKAYNLTPNTIRSLLTRNNREKAFLGHAYDKDRRFFVNLTADYSEVIDIEDIIVNPTSQIRLKDVAKITFGEKEQTTISRVNGMEAVTLRLVRDAEVNLIDLSHRTRAAIDRLNEELATQGLEIVIQADSAEQMEQNINLIMKLALYGGMLAVVILWLFLQNFRLVTIVILAIPISVLTAFNLFYGFGITINSLTLVGLALAIGMLLDNSVVVLENIYRHVTLHEDRDTAVIMGTREVWRSIFAATITTVTVFVPFIFSDDALVQVVGKHIGISIIATLFISLSLALLLIPMLVHTMLAVKERSGASFIRVSMKNRLVQIYTLLLKFAMRYPGYTFLGSITLFFISISLCLTMSATVPREVDLTQFSLYITMPGGSTLSQTDSAAKECEGRLAGVKEIKDVVTTVYEAEASVIVVLQDDYEKIDGRTIPGIRRDIEERIRRFPVGTISLSEPSSSQRFGGMRGANPTASLERMFGIGAQEEKIVIHGSNFDLLNAVADDITYYLEELESVESTSVSISRESPEIHLEFDSMLMNEYGVTSADITQELGTFQSEISSGATFKQGADEYDIVIRPETVPVDKTYGDLASMVVEGDEGSFVPLDRLSRIVFSSGKANINRVNQDKLVEVTYSFPDDVNESESVLETARREVDDAIAGLSIPAGVAVETVHEETAANDFAPLIIIAFLLIYMILAAVFESFLAPVVMMFTIPLATIGAFWALILSGNSLLNANALIGLLILLGVVVNNGIILIDFTRILRRRGFSRNRALMTAGRARVRPILITTVTTIVAMLPLAMGKTEYIARIGAPFAITVIGGLAMGTLFTLVFIPSLYSALENAVEWFRSLKRPLRFSILTVCAGASLGIYLSVSSPLWRVGYILMTVTGVPWFVWFAMTSLRRAKKDIVAADESFTVSIGNLVKTYDDDNRFVKEWKKGGRMRTIMGVDNTIGFGRLVKDFVWLIPVTGFAIYFTFWYVESNYWTVALSFVIYWLGFLMLGRIKRYSNGDGAFRRDIGKAMRWLVWVYACLFPLVTLDKYYMHGVPLPIVVFIGALWFAAIGVYVIAERLYRRKINIMRLTGRFAGVRRRIYKFVSVIPFLGRRKRPMNALNRVSLEIGNGMFGLLGPNGAGKTTLMRIVCGILDQSMGSVRIHGIDFAKQREELLWLIGYLPQEFGTYETMTAKEYLDYIAILKGVTDYKRRREIVDYVLRSTHLETHADKKIGTFSGGMKQRVGIAMTLLHLPRILVVDEPTAGLDPRERIRFRNLLVELSTNRIVIFSTHIIEDVASSCDNLAVMDKGRIAYLGSPRQITDAARGHVWQFEADPAEFEELRASLRIVLHMQIGGRVRIRCLSETCPIPQAESVEPSLEDAYLWLIGSGIKVIEEPREVSA